MSFLLFVLLKAQPESTKILLATTTSLENSGLLAKLLPPFEEETGIKVMVMPLGTGKALAVARNGDADCIFIHDRQRAKNFVQEGYGTQILELMQSEFVIVGPPDDPSDVRSATTPEEAFRRIAKARATFISRGDKSGTHSRELKIWQVTGIKPSGKWYLESGQGMGATLIIADEKRGYTLADTATLYAYKKKLEIIVLYRGGLPNPYQFIPVNPARSNKVNADATRKLLSYLKSDCARAIIKNFEIAGVRPFKLLLK